MKLLGLGISGALWIVTIIVLIICTWVLVAHDSLSAVSWATAIGVWDAMAVVGCTVWLWTEYWKIRPTPS